MAGIAEHGVILVDSSVWVELLRGTGSRAHRTIARLVGEGAAIATTEVVVGELLAGVRDEIAYRRLRRELLALEMLSPSPWKCSRSTDCGASSAPRRSRGTVEPVAYRPV